MFGVSVGYGLPGIAIDRCSAFGFSMRDTVMCAVVWCISSDIVMYVAVSFVSWMGGAVGGVVVFSSYGVR